MSPFLEHSAEAAGAGALGEQALLRRIEEWIRPVSPPSPEGFGDDAAVLPWRSDRVVATVDALLYGRHFDASATAEAAGHKLLHRNLSDVAAMGGTPQAGLLALTFGADLSLVWLEGFYRGLVEGCRQHGVTLAGGDLSEGAPGTFGAYLTVLGHAPVRPLRQIGRAHV